MKQIRRIRAGFFKLKVDNDQGGLVSQHQKKDDEDLKGHVHNLLEENDEDQKV
jgi:hypothetical protein